MLSFFEISKIKLSNIDTVNFVKNTQVEESVVEPCVHVTGEPCHL